MKTKGWNWKDTPTYKHDCNKCTFLFSLTLIGIDNLGRNDRILKTIDVYESCQKERGGSPWIIRYSSDPSDYATTDLKTLAAYHTIGHFDFLQ